MFMKRSVQHLSLWYIFFSILFSFNLHAQNKGTTSTMVKQASDQIDVYICGSWYDKNTMQSYAAYWKNGKPVVLKDGQTPTNFSAVSCAWSIAVDGSNVHVVGEMLNAKNHSLAAYWKNQKLQPLQIKQPQNGTTGASSAAGVEVKNGNVYIFPNVNTWIKENYYLKNGQQTLFPNEMPTAHSNNRAHFVSGDDIYLVASDEAAYWKNGKKVVVDNTVTGFDRARATGIFVAGGDVYVSGIKSFVRKDASTPNKSIAVYWKNGKEVILSTGVGPNNTRLTNSIHVSGSDIYVAGARQDTETGHTFAVYWKNGNEIILGKGPTFTQAQYIAVAGNDVYVAGEIGNKKVYWKNGKEIALPECSLLYYMVIAKGGISGPTTSEEQNNNVLLLNPTEDAKNFLAENKKRPGVMTTASGLQYEIIKQGTGPKPLVTDKVKIINRRDIIVGKEITETGRYSAPMNHNIRELIPGLVEGLQMMSVGSKYKFYIPARLAQGESKAPGFTFIFETELLEIIR